MDYIYQGPIILVLLVGPQWELGLGWAPGGLQRTHCRDAGEGRGLERPLPPAPTHTLHCTALLGTPFSLFQHSDAAPFPSLALGFFLWAESESDWQISSASDI